MFFISTRVQTEPSPQEPVLLEEEIRSICYNSQHVGVVTANSEGSDPYRLLIYDGDGREKLDQTFDFPYTDLSIEDDSIFLYNDSGCQVYNMRGTLKFSGELDMTVSGMMKGTLPGTLLVLGPQSIREIRLN